MAEERSNPIARLWFRLVKLVRGYFIFVGVMVTLLWVGTAVLISKGSKLELDVPHASLSKDKPSALWLEMSGKVSEEEPGITDLLMSRLFNGEHEVYLPSVRQALSKAAKDDRVSELVINMLPVRASAADYAALRKALIDFRSTSGKPVRVFMSGISDWTYYVASAGTTISLNPTGDVTLTGPTFQLVYFGEALKKLGFSFEVVRAGKYKSAFEPFVQNAPSEPTLEEYNSMQGSLLDHIVAAVVTSRGKDESTVRGWFKKSLYTPEEALRAGIVDKLGYTPRIADEDEQPKAEGAKVASEIQAEPAMHDVLDLEDYLSAIKHEPKKQERVTDKGGIALISAKGEISLQSRSAGPSGDDDGINPDDMRKELNWALENPDVKAVVLRVSSPGGSATASDMIWSDVQELAAVKPLVVSMGAYAASGGYYIVAPARRIYAEPTTITGSIGVIGMLPSAESFEDKWGVSFHMVSSSDRKQMLNLGTKASAEDKALLEKSIASVYHTFTRKVAEGRKLPIEKVEALAQGRVYTGLQAKEIGLVDEIGGVDAAIRKAKELAGFDPEKLYPLLRFEESSFSLTDCLRRPSRLTECLRHAGTKTRAPLLAAAANARTPDQVAASLANWVSAPQRERALTLWSGYLSLLWP